MPPLLLYATLFVFGLGLSFVAPLFVMVAVDAGTARTIGRKYLTIFLVSVAKPVLTINPSNELTLKRRSYDETLDCEKIAFGGLMSSITRRLRDPGDRLHRFYGGVRFAFVDELSGVVFDARDADVGRSAWEHREAGTLSTVKSSTGEHHSIYIRSVFELPEGVRGVSLQRVWHLLGGSANSQYIDWLIEMYEESQDPRSEQLTTMQMLAPVAALGTILVIGALIADMGGGGGGGGSSGGGGTIIGLLLLWAIPNTETLRDWVRERWQYLAAVGSALAAIVGTYIGAGVSAAGVVVAMLAVATLVGAIIHTWKPVYRAYLTAFGLVVMVGGFVLGLLSVFSITGTLTLLVVLTLGFLFLPALAWFGGRSLGGLGVLLGKLYAILGFFGFSEPVIYLTERNRYEVVDAAAVDIDPEPDWYRFAKTWVGVSYENAPGVWPGRESAIGPDTLEKFLQDGDTAPDELPHGTTLANMSCGGHQGFAPKRTAPDSVYVKSGHALSWFREVGRGRLLVRALKQAKEDHFGGSNDNETFVRNAVLGMALVGLVVDWVMFF